MPHKRPKLSKRKSDREAAGHDLAPTGSDDWHFGMMPKGAMRIIQGAKHAEEFRQKRQARELASQTEQTSKAKPKPSDKQTAETLKVRPGEKLRDFNLRVEQALASDIHASFRSETRAPINKRNRERRAARAAGLDPNTDPDGKDAKQQEEQRKTRADKAAALKAAEPTSLDLERQRQALETSGEIREFVKASQIKKINDVAMAPPTLTKAPRGQSLPAKIRKAQLMAKIGGNDEEEATRNAVRSEEARSKGRIPHNVSNNRKRTSDGQVKPSMARQRILDEERDKAIKLYRQMKEKKIQQAELKRASKSV